MFSFSKKPFFFLGKSSPNGLSASTNEISGPPQRRGTALSPRLAALGPMLGSARNSPLVKRKKSGTKTTEPKPESDELTSPNSLKPRPQQLERTSEREGGDIGSPKTSKAMKLLGMNDELGGSADSIAKLSPVVSRSPRQTGGGAAFLKELEAAKQSRTSGSSNTFLFYSIFF
jgi:hypothetical protein